MNYELAKQLKDAGFPQKGILYWGYNDHEYPMHISLVALSEPDTTVCLNPQLNELIEACGDRFELLERDFNVNRWIAMPPMQIVKDSGGWIQYSEKTPEEAVAKLWLELNKSK